MRILAFYPYVPYPLDRGAHYRGFYLLRELAREHEIDLLALAEQGIGLEHRSVFLDFCRQVEFIPFTHPEWERLFPRRLRNSIPSTVAHWTTPQAAEALRHRLMTDSYEAIHVFDIILAQYFLSDYRSLPLVLDRTRVDLQYQLMELRRMRPGWKARVLALENLVKLWRYERQVARRACLQVVCGEDDVSFLRRWVNPALNTVAIPNGVDTEYFQPPATPGEARADQPTLLFCGAMDYNPNIDALRWYFSEIHTSLRRAIHDLKVLIVGKDPVPEVAQYARQPNVIVTGAVPDVRPYYRQGWLQIVPLRIGGGTRLKIVESMAMGTPVVSTTIGAQGLGLRHDHDVLLADSARAFTEQTRRALQDKNLMQRLGHEGLRTVQGRLSWPQLGRQLTRLYGEQFGLHRPDTGGAALVRPQVGSRVSS